MEIFAPGVEPNKTFAIRYDRLGATSGNPDFRGKGSLTIEESGQRIVFSGKPKGRLFIGGSVQQTFLADQIWNVTANGAMVQFLTSEGRAGRRKQAFSFYCEASDIASYVAALLPPARDAAFAEVQQFDARLRGFEASSPWASITNLIVAANVLVYVEMGCLGAGWLEPGDMMAYVRFGANNAAATTDGEWWRLLTSMFMHYGILHLALNMWALVQVGHLVEKLFGRKAYALLYFGSGITGGLASMILHGDKLWSAGASGAIFGIYGALLGFIHRDESLLPKSVYKPLLKSTTLFVGYNLFYGAVQTGVDNAAHFGGLFGGFVLGWLMTVPIDPELRARFATRRLRAGIIAAVLLVGAGIAVVPRFDYKPVDELSWQKINEPRVPKEQEIVEHQNAEINRYRSTGDPGKLSIWLQFEAIPFYDDWNREILELPLEQGKLTYRRREAFTGILQMKIDSYRHLLSGINGNEPYPLRRFDDETSAISLAVKDASAR